MSQNRGLVKLLSLLLRHGIRDRELFRKILEHKTITNSSVAIEIVEIVRRQPDSIIIYEDEEGGVNEEPIYGVLIEYADIILSYMALGNKCLLKIKSKEETSKEFSLLKKIIEKYKYRETRK